MVHTARTVEERKCLTPALLRLLGLEMPRTDNRKLLPEPLDALR